MQSYEVREFGMPDGTLALVSMATIAVLHPVFLASTLLPIDTWCPSIARRFCGRNRQGAHGQRSRAQAGEQNRLEAKLLDIRVEAYISSIQLWAHMTGVYSAVYFGRMIFGRPEVNPGIVAFAFATAYITSLVLLMHPGLLRLKHGLLVAHIWYMALGLGVGVYEAGWDPPRFSSCYPQLILYRFTMSIAYPVASVNAIFNLAWLPVAVFGVLNDSESAPCRYETGPGLVTNEILFAVMFTYLLWKFDWHQVSRVRSCLEANGYLLAKKTMERLLADMCDAVVQLDACLGIRQPCPKLAGLLLRRNTGTDALQGENFANLVSTEEDCERFREFIARRAVPIEHGQHAPEDQSASSSYEDRGPSSMYLNLKDSTGTPVNVQVFHSCHRDPPDDVCHIVGVHEIDHYGREGVARDTFGGRGVSAFQVEDTDANSVASAGGSRSSSDTAASLIAPLIPARSVLNPDTVFFDGNAMEIVAPGSGFQALTGPIMYKAKLKDFVVNYDDFLDWVHAEVNLFFAGEESSGATKFELILAPSTGRKEANLSVHAEAYIVDAEMDIKASEMGIEMPSDVDDEEFELLVHMVLRKPEAQWRREKQKHSRQRRAIMRAVPIAD